MYCVYRLILLSISFHRTMMTQNTQAQQLKRSRALMTSSGRNPIKAWDLRSYRKPKTL